jgi:hypothetical protein
MNTRAAEVAVAKRASRKQAKTKRASAKRTAGRAVPRRSARKTSKPAAKAKRRKSTASTSRKRTAKTTRKKTTTTARRKTASRAAASRGRRAAAARKKPSTLASAAQAVRGAAAGMIAVVSRRLPGGSSAPPDAIELLENDHRRMEQLLAEGEDTTEAAVKRRATLLETLVSELNLHELIEERVLYPALQAHPEARDIVLEGFQEHHVADLIVAELKQVSEGDERWGAKFKVLKENIEHHIEEEEGEMFRKARQIFSREELRELGERMAELKATQKP